MALAALRAWAAGLLAWLLAMLGAAVWPVLPWSALALPNALVLMVGWRAGWLAWLGALAGLASALLGLGLPMVLVLAATACVGTSTALGLGLLRRLRFDARMEQGHDVAVLALAAGVVAVVPTALALAAALATQAGPERDGMLGLFLAGGTTLGLGSLGGALSLFSIDRSLLLALQRSHLGWRTATGGTLLLGLAAVLALAPTSAHPAVVAVALAAPPVALVWLALRGQFTLASAGLVGLGLLGAKGVEHGLFLSAGSHGMLAVWLASMLASLLLVQAATAQWRQHTQRWEWALDGSRLGVADWAIGQRTGFASTAWRALSGHLGATWSPTAWRERVHPEDQPLLDQAIAALSSGDAGRREIELRHPAPGSSGGVTWRWLDATLMVIERDAEDRPVRLLATLADIHDKRQAQERQRMSAALFQHLHEGLLITDAELRVLDVNPAYLEILGLNRSELIGQVPSLLRAAADDASAREQRAAMWATLRDEDRWRGELLERRLDGTRCTLQTTISIVRDGGGGLRYHVLVISDITEQQAQRQQLLHQAHFDGLTGLPNRVRLSQLLLQAMQAAERDDHLLVVCYVDLDHFKPVNDRHGHEAGDRLLVELAGRLRGALRSRSRWTDVAARLGGDEFVLLLHADDMESARLAVERVLRVVAQPYVVAGTQAPVQITASLGATVFPLDHSDADTLLRHADHAMYGAKQAGRNGCLFFDAEHRRRNEERVVAIGRIQEALDRQEFVLHYQPQVHMKTGQVVGLEALLRWEHPDHGLVPPLQFLPLVEHTGLSSRIGDWAIAHALEHLAVWRRQGLDIAVSVNVSARHVQEPDFAQRLTELLARHAEPLAAHLEIELLESTAHADIEATSALLSRCRGSGVRFALDDFGTGYSSLAYLKRLPVDRLKIDRSFVRHMLEDPQDRAIVQGVVALASTFDCEVVAEGVESPAQARALLDLGCEFGQGNGIAEPMPASMVAAWVCGYKGLFALTPAPEPALPPGTEGGAGGLGAAGADLTAR